MRRKKPDRPPIALAWFDEPQWRLLCTVVPDRDELDDTYEQWLQSARQLVRTVTAQGHQVERVHVDVTALAQWCRDENRPIDGPARADYVLHIVEQQSGGEHGRPA